MNNNAKVSLPINQSFVNTTPDAIKKRRKHKIHLPSWATMLIIFVSMLLTIAILAGACFVCPVIFAGVLITALLVQVIPKDNGVFEYYVRDNSIEIDGLVNEDFSGVLTIPEYIDGKPVTEIGSYAFSTTNITEVYIPNTVTLISSYAFDNCPNLKVVHIGENVQAINHSAFNYCPSLTTVYMGDCVEYISSYAFAECISLENIELSSSLSDINHGAFENCESLKEITIPKSVTNIGADAFNGCDSLKNVYFEKTNGWEITTTYSSDEIILYDSSFSSDPSQAATDLTKTYVSYHWSNNQ